MKIVFDIEADNLLQNVTRIWCIGIKQDNQPIRVYSDSRLPKSAGTLQQALDLLNQADTLIGHNIIGYDIPVIYKLTDINLFDKDIKDTLLLSKIILPNIHEYDYSNPNIQPTDYGKYSLHSFGQRFGDAKGEYSDWSKLTNDMLLYCAQDVSITSRLEAFLTKQEHYPSQRTILLENTVKWIITLQEYYGFTFDLEKAEKLKNKLILEKFNINRNLQKLFRPLLLPIGEEDSPKKLINRKQYIKRKKYIPLLGTDL